MQDGTPAPRCRPGRQQPQQEQQQLRAPAPPSPRRQRAAGCSTPPAGRDAAPHGQRSSSSARRPGPPFVGLRRAERSRGTAGGRVPGAPPTPRDALRCATRPSQPCRGENAPDAAPLPGRSKPAAGCSQPAGNASQPYPGNDSGRRPPPPLLSLLPGRRPAPRAAGDRAGGAAAGGARAGGGGAALGARGSHLQGNASGRSRPRRSGAGCVPSTENGQEGQS